MGCHDDSTHSLHNVVYALFWRPRSNRDMQVQSPSRPWHKAKLTSISSRSCKLRRAHCHDIMGIMRSPFIKPQDLFIVAPRHATNSNTTTLSTCFGYIVAQLCYDDSNDSVRQRPFSTKVSSTVVCNEFTFATLFHCHDHIPHYTVL